VATTRPATPENRNAVKASFVWYMGGLLVFFSMADWGVKGWTESYWIWTMAKDTIFIFALWSVCEKYRKQIFPILFYSIIRTVWEIIAQGFNKDVNNSMVLDYMFYIILSIVILNLLTQLKKEWNRNS
jgi:hypothetical protein